MSARPIPADTREHQRRASDPALSAWVSAHAGSGKTHVLSRRVVRLLLSHVPPSRILCLTYTKAAAANMSARIFDILAKWAMLDDEGLARAIIDAGAGAPSPADLTFARRLFARAVETPGGLKIQTIHAFCERLLHLFPFEANVGAGFRVMDDLERAELLQAARQHTLARAIEDSGALHEALRRVAGETSANVFDTLCQELMGFRESLRGMADGGAYASELRARLGLGAHETLGWINNEIIEGGLASRQWPSIAERLRGGSKTDAKLADSLMRAFMLAPHEDCIEEYFDVFFTQKREPRANAITGALAKKEPGLLGLMQMECERIAPLMEKRKAARIVDRSLALSVLGDALISEYQRMKSDRGLFDFDDLIERVRGLLRRSSPSWVLYKLDQQIDHILLDEAQDTSAAQWEILSSFANEFSAGEGARKISRTFFAVGDEKQSIFSFQGAAPEKFNETRREFEKRFKSAGACFETVRLTRSFRSAPVILQAVDQVFAGENARGLWFDKDEPAPQHFAWKTDVAGLVEIWDLIGGEAAEAPADWRLPLDYRSEADPAAKLARKIARKVRTLLAPDSGECVEEKGALRPIEAGDILVLVRKRDAFFEAVIRALKAEHVAVAGADRLELTKHIAVMDLAALGRAALLPHDDLSLAALLKSPLAGLGDDDLIALAPKRAGSLFDALTQSPSAAHREAAERVLRWMRDAATLAPFDFYARVLGADGGRARLLARLGPEASDAIDEFLRLALSFEREQAPSLTSFLATIETLDVSIKRDMEAAGGAVRVMTVHAAKGLEAKIVFLPDICGAPAGRHDPKLFALGAEGEDSALAWSLNMGSDCEAVARERARLREAERDEHARLLYVALTRAEERLYIAGFHGAKGPAPGCWHEMIYCALEPQCDTRPDSFDPDKTILYMGGVERRHDLPRPAPSVAGIDIPLWAKTPAPLETQPAPPLRPSNGLAGADALAPLEGPLTPTSETAERLAIGRLTHVLLQHLPQCAPERRSNAARRFLDARGAQLDEARRVELARAALAVIGNEQLAPLFGANSIAEVDIAAKLDAPQGEIAISGRIDRLAVTEREVFIADFKTGRPRGEPGPEQLRQLALYRAAVAPLYPDRKLRCVLVWTQDASVVEPSLEALDAALREIAAT